jgi:peptidoglycan/LPS O-acetylase OafA/YrhL
MTFVKDSPTSPTIQGPQRYGNRAGAFDYRPEIDGLRALAVIPVILFHAGFGVFRGGFVGVDVFFVISGYLITTLILNAKKTGQFTIAGFYERRARRILPALFFVMLACLIPAWLWMLPDQMKGFSQSLIAVSAFVSNIFFRNTGGYFDSLAAEKPLLHTWSLGVEEQYYVVFPIVVVLCWRLGRKRLAWIVAAAAIASFGLSEWWWRQDPVANFYLAPTRAWELLLGSVVAFASFDTPLHRRFAQRQNDLLAGLGLALLVGSVFYCSEAMPFPSAYALPPTLGAALVIGFANSNTMVARLLSMKWIVGIGLISYSAYLWHQPLFAFARILTLNTVEKHVMALLAVLSLPLAFLTWRFVEVPFRRRGAFSRKTIFSAGVVMSLTFVGVGTLGSLVPQSSDGAYLKRPNFGLSSQCEFATDFTPIPACVTSSEPRFVVWGDSYAMHLVPALVASAPGIKLAQATRSVCGPLIDVGPFLNAASYYNRSWAEECIKFNRSVISYIENEKAVEVVVLSSPFVQYVAESYFSLLTPAGEGQPSLQFAVDAMKKTIDTLRRAGKRVVLVAPLPRADYNMGDCAERLLLGKPVLGRLDSCRFDREAYAKRHKNELAFLEQMEKDGYVKVFWFEDFLCDNGSCVTTKDGVSIYRDVEHLSYSGSEYLGRSIGFADRLDRMAK